MHYGRIEITDDETDALILEYLQRIDRKLDETLKILDDFLSQPSPMDRLETATEQAKRVERIERRLDLSEAPEA